MEPTLLSSVIWYNKKQKMQVSAGMWILEKVLHQEGHAALEHFMKLGDRISILEVFWNLKSKLAQASTGCGPTLSRDIQLGWL